MNTSKTLLAILILFSIFYLTVATLETNQRINDLECNLGNLYTIAPETLEPPRFEDFDTVEHYATALRHYELGGTWATLENGYICNLNN